MNTNIFDYLDRIAPGGPPRDMTPQETNQRKVARAVCMICSKGPPTHDLILHRINCVGEPGIWACDAHAHQALQTYARAFGIERVKPEARQYVRISDE